MKNIHIALAVGLMIVGQSQIMAKPLKVYILVGQSNMEGHGNIRTLDYLADDPKTAPMLKEMRTADGKPRVCENVWINYNGERKGRLKAGFGAGPTEIGPELGFGIYMQKHVNEPILIIKNAWGGKDLYCDFYPPSAGKPAYELGTKHGRPRVLGHYYRLMMKQTREALANIKSVYPGYDPKQGYELAGFVWFQGWNDMCAGGIYPDGEKNPDGYKLYTKLMAQFIRDVRKDLNAPKMRFVIGTIGVNGDKAKGRIANLRKAMAATAEIDEFKGNVLAVDTGQFWDYEMAALERYAGDVNLLPTTARLLDNNGVMYRQQKGEKGWKLIGAPAQQDRIWRYISIDPQVDNDKMENKKERKRFRDITLPKGLDGWYKPEFDDSDWNSGKAPIGKGVWKYPNGTRPLTPRNVSDWGNGEFILMRTTFHLDKLPSYAAYRISILARQGFHVYLNGYKINTYIWWKDRPLYRAVNIDSKYLKKGENVLAAYSLVHYDRVGKDEYKPYASIDLALEGIAAEDQAYVASREFYLKRVDRLFNHLTMKQRKTICGASNGGYHYLGSAKMLGQIGKAFADAMAEMQR